MTRHSRRNSRAARRKQVAGMQATIHGMEGMQQRANDRARQARATLNAARAELETVNAALRQMGVEKARSAALLYSAAQLVKMVRAECVINPPTSSATTLRDDTEFFNLPAYVMAEEMAYRPDAPATMRMMHDTMHVLRTKAVREAFDRRIHLRVMLAGGCAGYGISEEALLYHDQAELIEHISKELAPLLIHEVRKVLPQRGRFNHDPRSFRG